jgi:cytochrome c2
MTHTWLANGVLAAILLGATAGLAEEKAAAPKLPTHWQFSLPAGDAEAGKAAFVKMDCTACHHVPDSSLPRPRTSGGVGPDLGAGYARLPREYLAESIINRHKYIAGTLEKQTGQQTVSSRMADYNGILSVRDLIDIIEFLKRPAPQP